MKLFNLPFCLTYQNTTTLEVSMRNKKIWAVLLGLAMIALCGLMILVAFFSLRAVRSSGFSPSSLRIGIPNVTAQADEVKTLSVTAPASLEITNPFGDVTLMGTEDDQIKISMHKVAYGVDQKSADDQLKELVVTIKQDGSSVIIDVPEPNGVVINKSAFIDFVIEVPRETAVNLDVKSGNLDISNLADNTDLHSSFGSITLTGLQKGRLSATSESGSITIKDIMSDDQPVELSSDFGSIDLTDTRTSKVTVSTKNGEVKFASVESSGPIVVTNEFGEINLEETGGESIDITSKNGSINLKETRITTSLTVKNDFGDIVLHDAFAKSLDLQNKNGSITLDHTNGIITASTEFGSIQISNGKDCGLILSSKNGSISYEGSIGVGPHDLSSDFGSIDLKLPSDTALTVDLKTEFGEINNAFEITTDGKVKEHHQTGKINGGGASMNIKVNNGSITLEKTESIKERTQ
jgi:hypothetical protein